jgi:DNA polymerase I-like protein with 3'-5' exonuclease and polymerase domains
MKKLSTNKDYYLVETEKDIAQAFFYLNGYEDRIQDTFISHELIALDTETDSTNVRNCNLIGVSLSCQEKEAFYFPYKEYNVETKEIFKNHLKSFELDNHKRIICHNAAFDILVLRNTLGIDLLSHLTADTMLMKHLVDEFRPHGLKDCATKYLGIPNTEELDLKASVIKNGGKFSKTQKDIYLADLDILALYAANDADITYQLYWKLFPLLQKEELETFYDEEVAPLLHVTINHLLSKGVYCDIPYFNKLKLELEEQSKDLEQQAHFLLKSNYSKHYYSLEQELLEEEYPIKKTGQFAKELFIRAELGESLLKKDLKKIYEQNPSNPVIMWKLGIMTDSDFYMECADLIYETRKSLYLQKHKSPYIINLASTKQLKTLLFKKLGERPTKKTKKDNIQVDNEVMNTFIDKYEWIAKLMELRKVEKLLSTYVLPIIEKNEQGVVYSDWMQHGTDTGRFAGRNPNFMNLPRTDTRIKRGIIAPEGYVLVASDYSQLEPRCFSHLSSEPLLIESFKQGIDVYGAIAVDLWKLPCDPSEVKDKYPNERQIAKTILLALSYGLKKWHLSKILQCEVEQAEEFIDNFWQTYTNLDAFVKRSHATAYRDEAIRSETGRVRHLDGLLMLRKNPDMAKRLGQLLNISVNFQVQSLAASITNRATIKLAEALAENQLDAWIELQVHDELTCCARKDQAEQVAQLMKECMEGAYQLSVPLIANPIIGDNLAKCK